MAREYWAAYHSYLEAMEELNDAERGRLFTACLQYSMTGAAERLSGSERYVFPAIRAQIDRDNQRYDGFVAKQAENGKQGGRPRKAETQTFAAKAMETQKTQAFLEEPKKTKEKEKTKEKAMAKEKAKEPIPPLSPPKGEAGFDRFWAAYPRKEAKQAARKAWEKLAPNEALAAAILQSLNQLRATPQWQKDGGQYIPHPSTFLNGRRWEDAGTGPGSSRYGNLERLYQAALLEEEEEK